MPKIGPNWQKSAKEKIRLADNNRQRNQKHLYGIYLRKEAFMVRKVTTKDQLKKAVKKKEKVISIDNPDLAKKIVKFKKIKKLSKWTLGLLITGSGVGALGMALAPATGGSSAVVGGASSAMFFSITTASGTIISAEAIFAIGTLFVIGSAVLYSIYKDYDVEIESTNPWKIKLHKS
jgi:hypothetical protein